MVNFRRECLFLSIVLASPAAFTPRSIVAQSAAQTDHVVPSGTTGAKLGQVTPPSFEVATIRPAASSPDGHTHINYPDGGGFSASNISLITLMQWAYDMPAKRILEGSTWMNSARFDIKAKGDANTDSQLRTLPSSEANRLKRQMVQALLADRFSLKVGTETRILTAYDMTLAKGGSKLQASTSNGKSAGVGRTYFHGQGLTADLIAEQLSGITGRAVVDKTGLPDRYDLKLEWTPDDAPTTDSSAPSLFTAIQEQLGLKLISAEEPLPVLVIQHVEQPSPN